MRARRSPASPKPAAPPGARHRGKARWANRGAVAGTARVRVRLRPPPAQWPQATPGPRPAPAPPARARSAAAGALPRRWAGSRCAAAAPATPWACWGMLCQCARLGLSLWPKPIRSGTSRRLACACSAVMLPAHCGHQPLGPCSSSHAGAAGSAPGRSSRCRRKPPRAGKSATQRWCARHWGKSCHTGSKAASGVRSASGRSGCWVARAWLRRWAKKSCSSAAHSCARTPPCTVVWWLSAAMANRSSTEPAAPVLGSGAPYTSRRSRACSMAWAHMAQGSSVT